MRTVAALLGMAKVRMSWMDCSSFALRIACCHAVENGDNRAGDGIDVFAVLRMRGVT